MKVKKNKRSASRIALGILFIIIGIIGGPTPIVQGWVFILLGCALIFGKKFTDYIRNLKSKYT